jgi:diaminohydroxyphosphoribosylaminopyrimidine deaminase/5-amino-6-(5-phosphoribosylamino)uracil reductase
MARALALAVRGEGFVEPNPMVGCVIVRDGAMIAEGWHERFGEWHAEIAALKQLKMQARGATAYVSLEPCCHQGKTPPCTQALIRAGVSRVVVAMEDPFPPVDGSGMAELKAAGIDCEVGLLGPQARYLNAPYLKRLMTGRPWVIAKWAATRDGKLAMADGTRWISNEHSRDVAHQLRGRVDAIVVGSGTVEADDPLLTARPKNPAHVKRTAARVVVDSQASLSLDSQLVRTAREVPLIVAVASSASVEACRRLVDRGVEILPCAGTSHAERFDSLLEELARRRMTNVLVEGGGRLLRTVFEMGAVDEVHVFRSPKDAGGDAPPALALDKLRLVNLASRNLDGDEYIGARVAT